MKKTRNLSLKTPPWPRPLLRFRKGQEVSLHTQTFLLNLTKQHRFTLFFLESESEVAQSCPTLSDLMDCSPPGSSVHGIFQAIVLEWVVIAFS